MIDRFTDFVSLLGKRPTRQANVHVSHAAMPTKHVGAGVNVVVKFPITVRDAANVVVDIM